MNSAPPSNFVTKAPSSRKSYVQSQSPINTYLPRMKGSASR
jgi:hypothetical protein